MPEWNGPYLLKIKVISAALTKNTDILGKMDPFPVIEFCKPAGSNTVSKKFRGPTHKGGHKAPLWNWNLDIYFGGEIFINSTGHKPSLTERIKIAIYEEDTVNNDFIGESEPVLLDSFYSGGVVGGKSTQTQQFLFAGGKPVGSCLIEL
jgi:hypothetical protein